MFFTVAAYVLWGLFPAFFPLLDAASPLEIVAHRVLWTAVFVTGYLVFSGSWRELAALDRRSWGWLAAAGFFVTINWGTYVLTVNSGHVADASLGYYINPLLSVALGMIFLKERLRPWQLAAVLIATAAVAYLTFFTGQAPYLSLAIAMSFGIYGLLKKKISISAAGSVAAETLVMLPFALIYLTWLELRGESTFYHLGASHSLLLIASGIVTATPLLLFARGARELPLATVGMLQYITPCMLLLWSVFITHEHFSTHRWIGFGIIFVAVTIYLADLARAGARRRRAQHHAGP
ncbi:EamA family transporter RarD [Corynebacterium lizhenjunii]|uniref:EamA family transporter RarD n=1 Tax=Corynebacterium lizhenjunii TaxID=2709394 RepID=A0A7T0KCZ1_9CORY|nr:EamA family transporter RarD [Corynebacterium lizhenjunii]QPK78488.1 EamA family transporter RarD [Corynebacterium lizhenjunii]